MRLPHLTRADFLNHWRDVHAPLIASLANALGVRRYVQFHGLDGDTLGTLGVRPSALPEWDGIAQIWFDDQEAALRARNTIDGKAAIARVRADELLFLDRARSIAWWGEPHVVIGGAA